MLKVRSIILVCIALSVLSLPLAQLKVSILGIPLYSIEIPILVALVAYLYGWWCGTFSPFEDPHFCNPFVIGATLFFLGAVISFVANPFSLTGLGMMKTWFFFPLLAIWLWFQTEPTESDRGRLLFVWFGTITVVAVASLVFLLQGTLTYDGRLAAWYVSPNYLAIFLAPGVLLAHYFYFHPIFLKTKITQLFICLALTLLLVILFFTHSYAVWISIALAALLFLFLDTASISSWRKTLAIAFLLTVTVSTFILFESSSPKWQSLIALQNRSSMASRMMIWQSAGKMIADNPFFGIGLGRFQEVYLEYQKYYPPYLEWAVPQPHNIVLAVWLQTGLIGLIGFIFLVSRAIVLLLKNKNRESVLLLGILVLYLLYGLFDTPFFKTDLAFTFWLVIGFAYSSAYFTDLSDRDAW